MSTVSLGKRLIAVYWPVGDEWCVGVLGMEPSRFADQGEAFQWVFDQAVKFDA